MTIAKQLLTLVPMEAFDVRKRNLLSLVRQYGRQQALADAVSLSVQYINQMVSGHRTIGEKTARKIEKALSLAPGWMDVDSDVAAPRDLMKVVAANDDLVKVAAVNDDDVVEVSRESLALLRMLNSLSEKDRATLHALVDSLTQQKANGTGVIKKVG